MKKLAQALTLALIALAVKPALAVDSLYDQSGMFYIPFSVGEYMPESSRQINNSFYGSLGIGYNFTNVLALQTQLGLFAPNNQTNSNSAMHATLWTVEGRVNAANATRVVPYAVVGIGTLAMPGAELVEDYGLGIEVKLAPTVSFGVSARQVLQNNPQHLDTLLTGSFTWYFGGNKQLPLTQNQQSMIAKAQTTLKPVLPAGVVPCKDNKLGNQAGCVTFENNTMVMHLNVRFEQNKAKIQSQYTTPIISVGNFMHAYTDTTITLFGYASSEGSKAFNQELSLKRAEAVADYLMDQAQVAQSRIKTVGMGIQDPIASNATLEGRQTNRRVEAKIPVPYDLDH